MKKGIGLCANRGESIRVCAGLGGTISMNKKLPVNFLTGSWMCCEVFLAYGLGVPATAMPTHEKSRLALVAPELIQIG